MIAPLLDPVLTHDALIAKSGLVRRWRVTV
jgi:hypothetical protein